jgi:hypothetical protein
VPLQRPTAHPATLLAVVDADHLVSVWIALELNAIALVEGHGVHAIGQMIPQAKKKAMSIMNLPEDFVKINAIALVRGCVGSW